MVPVNLRQPGEFELGIISASSPSNCPIGIENPPTRLYELRRRMDELKKSYEPPVTLGLFAALGYARKLVQDTLFDLLATRAAAVATNVPGPQYPSIWPARGSGRSCSPCRNRAISAWACRSCPSTTGILQFV